HRYLLGRLASHGVADNMKFLPSKLVGECDGIRGHFANRILAGNAARVAVAADVDESEGVAVGVQAVENRCEHPMVPEPSVNDHDFCRAIADCLVPNHFRPPCFTMPTLPANAPSLSAIFDRPPQRLPCRPPLR